MTSKLDVLVVDDDPAFDVEDVPAPVDPVPADDVVSLVCDCVEEPTAEPPPVADVDGAPAACDPLNESELVDDPEGSAHANPEPVATAAPTPNAIPPKGVRARSRTTRL